MSYFNYTNLICSFYDPRRVASGLTLIHIGAHDLCVGKIIRLKFYFVRLKLWANISKIFCS